MVYLQATAYGLFKSIYWLWVIAEQIYLVGNGILQWLC